MVIKNSPPQVAVLLEGDTLSAIMRLIGERSEYELAELLNGRKGEAEALVDLYMDLPIDISNKYLEDNE